MLSSLSCAGRSLRLHVFPHIPHCVQLSHQDHLVFVVCSVPAVPLRKVQFFAALSMPNIAFIFFVQRHDFFSLQSPEAYVHAALWRPCHLWRHDWFVPNVHIGKADDWMGNVFVFFWFFGQKKPFMISGSDREQKNQQKNWNTGSPTSNPENTQNVIKSLSSASRAIASGLPQVLPIYFGVIAIRFGTLRDFFGFGFGFFVFESRISTIHE